MITSKFTLPVLPPFRLDFTVWALRRRNKNIIDSWDGTYYIRVFTLENEPVKVKIEQNINKSQIIITASSLRSIPAMQQTISKLLNRMLGLAVNLESFYHLARKDERLYSLVLQFMGLKPPRFPSLFESLANAIACQQVSLEAGLTLLNRLAQRYGLLFQEGDQAYYTFPEPQAIMHSTIEELRGLGFSRRKGEALINVASKIVLHKESDFGFEEKPNKEVIQLLSNLKGIGRWSIEYVLLRGLGRIGVFPGDDVGAQKNLKQLFALDEIPNHAQIQNLMEKWDPYAGLIYFHLLLQKLVEKGTLMLPS